MMNKLQYSIELQQCHIISQKCHIQGVTSFDYGPLLDSEIGSGNTALNNFTFSPQLCPLHWWIWISRLHWEFEVNFTNILHKAFNMQPRSQKRKKRLMAWLYFCLFGSACVKAACKMLVKSTTQGSINFINKFMCCT